MSDQTIPEATGGVSVIPPIEPTDRQNALCKKLDDWHAGNGLQAHPSDMLRGALFTARIELRENPDWIPQAANSLREILYPFWSKISSISERKEEALKKYGSVRISPELLEEIERIYGLLNDLTHHGCDPRWLPRFDKDFNTFSIPDFETLLDDFEKVMFVVMDRQLDIHGNIDDVNREISDALTATEVEVQEQSKTNT